MLFYVDSKNNCVLHPEVIKLCPSFRALDEKETLYVVLFADYTSPYKQFPEHDRKRKAMWHAFDDNETELIESARILAAVDDYMSLQWSPKIELAKTYQRKIDDLSRQLLEETAPTSISKIDDSIDKLTKRLNAMNKEVLDDYLIEGVLKGGRTKSFLEKILDNKKRYESVVGKKL